MNNILKNILLIISNMSKNSERYWFTNLSEEDKKYITEHPDPSHMIYYLQRGVQFEKALRLGYIDSVKEDIILDNEIDKARENVKSNLLL